jgi:DNA-directed RNA polymerase subunit F
MIQIQSDIPGQHAELYRDYVECLKDKLDTIMWVCLDHGKKVGMVEKEKHREHVEQLLKSGDERRVKVAIEVMKRSMGKWEGR